MRTNILKTKRKTIYYVLLSCFMLGGLCYPPVTVLADNMKTQQERMKVTGTIVDDFDEPLIGASIVEHGTSNGTVTDIDGKFELSVSNGNVVLSVSYIGYLPQEIP